MPYWFDGNNLIGQSAAAASANPKIRESFLRTLRSYCKSRGGKFLVYFDGDDRNRFASPPGVAVRYSAPLSTDDAILCRLSEIQRPFEVTVVTNDRNLTARCRNVGAETLTWHNFELKMKAGPVGRTREKRQQDPVDVEDWMRYFGLEKTED
jgi:predicted RNA-binding protein with PIN domain